MFSPVAVREARRANCLGHQDILDLAFQYVATAPVVWNDATPERRRIAGPSPHLLTCDFHDYVCIDCPAGECNASTTRPPDLLCQTSGACPDYPTQSPGMLDCSGYMRMIWGYRNNFTAQSYYANIELTGGLIDDKLTRTSEDQYNGPTAGTKIIDFRPGCPTPDDLGKLRVGDLVFFDINGNGGSSYTAIDHDGMYVGRDAQGDYRFISSRTSTGVSMRGDTESILNCSGSVSSSWPGWFRGARRL